MALRSALRVASAGLLPVPQGAFDPEQAGGGRSSELLQAPMGHAPPSFPSNIVVVRGLVPWASLLTSLRTLEPVSSGRWAVEDVCLTSLLVRPSWDGESGLAGRQAALEAGRLILRRRPSLLLIAPGFRAAQDGHSRSAAWPRGRVELPASKRSALHLEDLCWSAVAALLDAVLEVAAEELPAPAFALVLPEAFASARGRARLEPLLEARLDSLARLPGVRSGAFYQCAWAPQEAAAEPQRIISDLPFLLDDCAMGLPVLRAKRGAKGERCHSYCGPLPSSCSCGRAHRLRSSEEAAASEPLEPGASRRLVDLLGRRFAWEAAGPTALVGGELAAYTLLSGPPCRGPPVPSAGSGVREGWRPLDMYIGRNNRFGDTTWGNPFKVGRDGDASRCCRLFEAGLREDPSRWHQLGDLRGRRLRCHCSPGMPCHADSLIVLFCETMSAEVTASPPQHELGTQRRVLCPSLGAHRWQFLCGAEGGRVSC